MKFQRRAFLKQTALALAALGISQSSMAVAARRCFTALAEPAYRKLALLVGINQYPEQVCDYPIRGSALMGSLTDVKLQRELLIHRFGFAPDDILVLTDEQATRDGIERAFLTHLVGQARPGDVAFFHFSGLGSRVQVLDDTPTIRRSLVPIDGVLPQEDAPYINDLMEETLGLLLRAIPTEQVVTVLDLSYAEPKDALQGSLRIRSRPNMPSGQVGESELALQEQLRRQIGVSKDQAEQQWQSGQLPGVLLRAAGPAQVAAEGQWNGFSAGLFTYALTQQLWWLSSITDLNISVSLAGGEVEQVAGNQQQPVISGQKSQSKGLVNFRFKPKQSLPATADGVVLDMDATGGTAQLWLAGLPAPVLENYGVNSLLALVEPRESSQGSPEPSGMAIAPPPPPVENSSHPKDAASSPSSTEGESLATSATVASPASNSQNSGAIAPGAGRTTLQVRSRDGLRVKARPLGNLLNPAMAVQPGQLVQEYVRLLSKNINLVVALDAQLERIERVDATSALSGIPRISSVVAGEQPADFLFGKVQPASSRVAMSLGSDSSRDVSLAQAKPDALSKDGYGLFYLSRSAIPNTLITAEEAVKTAVNRIAPQLRTLLAAKMLRLTGNQGTSQLGVRATLEMLAPQERILMQQTTVRAPWKAPDNRLAVLFASQGDVPSLPIGSHIQFRIQNYSDRPVHCVLLGLDSGGNAIALYPSVLDAGSGDAGATLRESFIPPGEALVVPQPGISAEWVLGGPVGLAETYLVCSRRPLTRTAAALSKAMRPMGSLRQLSILTDPAQIVQAVLADLHDASLQERVGFDVPSDTYALHVASWATFNFIYRVVNA